MAPAVLQGYLTSLRYVPAATGGLPFHPLGSFPETAPNQNNQKTLLSHFSYGKKTYRMRS